MKTLLVAVALVLIPKVLLGAPELSSKQDIDGKEAERVDASLSATTLNSEIKAKLTARQGARHIGGEELCSSNKTALTICANGSVVVLPGAITGDIINAPNLNNAANEQRRRQARPNAGKE